MTQTQQRLWDAYKDADDRFQAALEAEYGAEAGDMRYRTNDLAPAIKDLALACQAASTEYWNSRGYVTTGAR